MFPYENLVIFIVVTRTSRL